ncbi:hypothetical protein CPB86DRAFT_459303 [Serendipita vermifera]|nr:hypothetical protein CPB86DRAFT_459303 [Serendipita vermifera]
MNTPISRWLIVFVSIWSSRAFPLLSWFDVGFNKRLMPQSKSDINATEEDARTPRASISPLAQRFPQYPLEPATREKSSTIDLRSSRTISPQEDIAARRRAVTLDRSSEDPRFNNAIARQAPSNMTALDSFSSTATRPPPSSTGDTPAQQIPLKDDTPSLVPEENSTSAFMNPHVLSIPRTPPPRPELSLHATVTPGKSPSRALSVPLGPVVRDTLGYEKATGTASPHRATSAIARRSARKPSGKRKPTPISSKRAPEPSPSKSTGSRLPLALDEADERSDDEQASPIETSSALAATRSMPELNESQDFPIAFLHDLIENQKKTTKGSAVQGSPERSTDAETQSSLSSREYRSWSRFHRSHAEASFRPMAQKVFGVNPPGITVHSQSQSDHAPHQNAVSEGRDDELEEETQPVTLVVGTPSSTSEFSQSDRPLDMSQLRRDGQVLLHLQDDETDIATQSIRASDDILVPTQVVNSGDHADGPVISRGDGQETLEESKNEYLIQALEVSPRKQRGYYSSSSGTSIPGLNMMNETFSQFTPSILAAGSQVDPVSPPKANKSPIKRLIQPNNDLPPPSDKGVPAAAMVNPTARPIKKNPLVRRKSPLPIDQYLFEREVTRQDSHVFNEETIPVDYEDESNRINPPIHNATTLQEETVVLSIGAAVKSLTPRHQVETLSDGGDSAIMETDGEPSPKPPKVSPLKPTDYVVPISGWMQSPVDEPESKHINEEDHGIVLSGQTLISSKKSAESVQTRSRSNAGTNIGRGSRSATVGLKRSIERKRTNQELEESSSPDDDTSDYEPQDTQTQDVVEKDDAESQEEDLDQLFSHSSRSLRNKRTAKTQKNPRAKRICVRETSPKALTTLDGSSLKREIPSVPVESFNESPTKSFASSAVTRRASRKTGGKGRSNSNATLLGAIGHLVMVRYPDAKKYFPGYAIARTGKVWQISPCDGGPAVFAEPKNMRKCIFELDDLVFVSADGEGDSCGDSIVIGIDERWEEDRMVLVRIAGREERPVALKYISVYDRHIKKWDNRKITHQELEKEDAGGSMAASTSMLTRVPSFHTSSSFGISGNSARTPRTPVGKHFLGVGFILTNCDDSVTKRILNGGGYIYSSWLQVYNFDGALEKIKGAAHRQRWIRRLPVGNDHLGKTITSPPLTWVGNENAQGVHTLFVIAGKVMMTPKILLSLALGIPFVSSQWIEACESAGHRVDWIPYLLPSHNVYTPLSLVPNVLPSQTPDYQWGSDQYKSFSILENILDHAPLSHHRLLIEKHKVLYIAPGCINLLKLDVDERQEFPPCKIPFVYCCLALGAQHVEAVEEYTHATENILNYDLILIADSLLEKQEKKARELRTILDNAAANGVLIMNQSDLKMSLACGKLMKLS